MAVGWGIRKYDQRNKGCPGSRPNLPGNNQPGNTALRPGSLPRRCSLMHLAPQGQVRPCKGRKCRRRNNRSAHNRRGQSRLRTRMERKCSTGFVAGTRSAFRHPYKCQCRHPRIRLDRWHRIYTPRRSRQQCRRGTHRNPRPPCIRFRMAPLGKSRYSSSRGKWSR